MAIVKKRWYFTLTKGTGKQKVELYLYLKNGKFKTTHALFTYHLLTWWQAHFYWVLFNLPGWLKKNGTMFGYSTTSGTVKKCSLTDDML